VTTHQRVPNWLLATALVLTSSGIAHAQERNEKSQTQSEREQQLLDLLREVAAEVKQLRREVAELRRELAARGQASSNVPASYQLTRKRRALDALRVELTDRRGEMAKEEVEMERLKSASGNLSQSVKAGGDAIDKLERLLSSKKDTYEIAGRTFTADQVRRDLAARKARQQELSAQRNRLIELLRFRSEALALSKQEQETLSRRIKVMEVEVETMNVEIRREKLQDAEEDSY
jgi:hypothetical protein